MDVVIGLLSCEQWPQTQLLAEKFEVLPCKTVMRDGRMDYEMDLDACLKRSPELILVDDLSHLNMDDSRHIKRYQDIEELLKAGVDVYTTLNVQHIESIQDTIFSILGSSVVERIPDRVFDQAARVEFVDIEPERLQQRLLQQKQGELLSGCTLSQLSALREIGLRRCADRAALYTQGPQKRMNTGLVNISWCAFLRLLLMRKLYARQHGWQVLSAAGLLLCLSKQRSFSGCRRRIRNAFRLIFILHSNWEHPLKRFMADDVAYQIAEFSRLSGVTKIVLGRSGISHYMFWRKPPLTERLIELIPELDIHIIPDNGLNGRFAAKHQEVMRLPTLSILDLLKSALLLILATLIGFLFYYLVSPRLILLHFIFWVLCWFPYLPKARYVALLHLLSVCLHLISFLRNPDFL